MSPADPFGLVGQVLEGQFQVERLVGEGGFSAVYRARHLGLDEPVAVKCLKLPPSLGQSLVDSFVQRFRDESRILYKLSQGNLHIVRSMAAGAAISVLGVPVPYMVLEWLEGRSLASDFSVRRANGKKGRALHDVMTIFSTAADALAFAHAQGVVHRDLNPGNLFLATTTHGVKMKVLDFGVAKILDDSTLNMGPRAQTMGQIRIFAPAYGAPEQFDDAVGPVGAHSDVYAFALVILEALQDRPVNDGANLSEFLAAATNPARRPTPRMLGIDVPAAVDAVFARATRFSTRERWRDVGEMWKALEAAAHATASAPNKRSAGRPAPGSMQRTLPLAGFDPSPRPQAGAGANPPRAGGAPGHRSASGLVVIRGDEGEDELPTQVGNSPLEASVTGPPKLHDDEENEEVTKVRASEAETPSDAGPETPRDAEPETPRAVPDSVDLDATMARPPPPVGRDEDAGLGTLWLSPEQNPAAPPPRKGPDGRAEALKLPGAASAFVPHGPPAYAAPAQPPPPVQPPANPFGATVVAGTQSPYAPGAHPVSAQQGALPQPMPLQPVAMPLHGQPTPHAPHGGFGGPPGAFGMPHGQAAYGQVAHAQPAPPQPAASKQPLVLYIVAGTFLVLALGGLGVFMMLGRGAPEPTDSSASGGPVPLPLPSPSPSAPLVPPPPIADLVGDDAGAVSAVAADASPAPTATGASTSTPTTTSNTAPTALATGTATANGPATAVPVPVPVPKPSPEPDSNAWNEGAARARLSQANGVLIFCRREGGVAGPGAALVTFDPDGTVSHVLVDPPYAGTKEGDCVAGQFKRAKISPFEGAARTIRHTFEVPK